MLKLQILCCLLLVAVAAARYLRSPYRLRESYDEYVPEVRYANRDERMSYNRWMSEKRKRDYNAYMEAYNRLRQHKREMMRDARNREYIEQMNLQDETMYADSDKEDTMRTPYEGKEYMSVYPKKDEFYENGELPEEIEASAPISRQDEKENVRTIPSKDAVKSVASNKMKEDSVDDTKEDNTSEHNEEAILVKVKDMTESATAVKDEPKVAPAPAEDAVKEEVSASAVKDEVKEVVPAPVVKDALAVEEVKEVVPAPVVKDAPAVEEVKEVVPAPAAVKDEIKEVVPAPAAVKDDVKEVVPAPAAVKDEIKEVVPAPAAVKDEVKEVVPAPAAVKDEVKEVVPAPAAVKDEVKEVVPAPAVKDVIKEVVPAPAVKDVVKEVDSAPVIEKVNEDSVNNLSELDQELANVEKQDMQRRIAMERAESVLRSAKKDDRSPMPLRDRYLMSRNMDAMIARKREMAMYYNDMRRAYEKKKKDMMRKHAEELRKKDMMRKHAEELDEMRRLAKARAEKKRDYHDQRRYSDYVRSNPYSFENLFQDDFEDGTPEVQPEDPF